MHREYHKWHSPNLGREMELLIFGHAGIPVLFFPTRCARFYDYENWGVLDEVQGKIDNGIYRFVCLDSIDNESLYCYWCRPEDRIKRHLLYEKYILEEVIPLVYGEHPRQLMAAGCSMGAYHAVNLVFKNPLLFSKVVGMSGRYDLNYEMGSFRNLFDDYWDQDIYFNMPSQYIPNMEDLNWLELLKKVEIILALGEEDQFLQNNSQLSDSLNEKQIPHSLYVWEREAHKPKYWKEMLALYF